MKSILKPLLLCLLATPSSYGFSTSKVKKGHCPTRPGDLKSQNLDPEVLGGQWINIFDRKGLNGHLECYSVRFE